MKSIFFNNEVLSVEKQIIEKVSVPSLILMENAGKNSADFILSKINPGSKIIILAGKGNNAGDGFVIARHLANNKIRSSVALLYNQEELKDDALINYNILKSYSEYVQINFFQSWERIKNIFDKKNLAVIDAVFGIGFKGELEERLKVIFENINRIKNKIVFGIDTPSGLFNYNQSQTALKCDYTISMGVKKFHTEFYYGREVSGEVKVVDIGVSSLFFYGYNKRNIYEVEQKDAASYIPSRNINSHKYSSGKVFALAGSKGLTGASYLCSQSALVTGSGAVILGAPESLNTILARKLTEVMTLPLPETNEMTLSSSAYEKMQEKIKWSDCVLMGPGVSKNEETLELITKIIKENGVPVVLDADGLAAFKNVKRQKRENKLILTPHLGEFANLLDVTIEELKNNFYEYAVNYAKEKNVILVLKGSPTVITDGKMFYINTTGNSILSTAGSGDVLSGIIASLYSRTKDALQSAIAGVYIHGRCADLLLTNKKNNFTFKATDFINKIPQSINSILGS